VGQAERLLTLCPSAQVWFQELHAALPPRHRELLRGIYLVRPWRRRPCLRMRLRHCICDQILPGRRHNLTRSQLWRTGAVTEPGLARAERGVSPLQVHPRSHWAATRSWMYLLRQQDPVYSKVRRPGGSPRAQA
jgi:hypothetical protein